MKKSIVNNIICDEYFFITVNYIFIDKLNYVSKIFLTMNISSKIISSLIIYSYFFKKIYEYIF